MTRPVLAGGAAERPDFMRPDETAADEPRRATERGWPMTDVLDPLKFRQRRQAIPLLGPLLGRRSPSGRLVSFPF